MSPNWIFCGVTVSTGLILPHDPYCMGMFEITRALDPFPGCDDALSASAKSFGEVVDLKGSYLVRTFFTNTADHGEVVRSGRLHAHEAINLLSHSLPMGMRLSLLRTGYTVQLETGAVQAILPPRSQRFSGPGQLVGVIDELELHPAGIVNSLLAASPSQFGELGQAIRRSTHWSGLASRLDDRGERILVLWMACETLTRVVDQESLTPKLVSALGFASGRYWAQLTAAEQAGLANSNSYQDWHPKLNALFDKLRDARNRIVHSGFRELELPSLVAEVDLAERVLLMTIPRLQALALNALALGIHTVTEMWGRYYECKSMHQKVSLVDEVENTIVFSLEEPADS